MNKNMLFKSTLAAALLTTSAYGFCHGYVESPGSRVALCTQSGGSLNSNCGPAMYEPQSIEALKGFPESGPADGKIASGGIDRFAELDEQSATRWHKVNLPAGENTFTWNLSATHKTTSWRFFITKKGWDVNAPLTRSQFNLKPFCERNDNGAMPSPNESIKCNIPADYHGYHAILAVWDIADTKNAFYQVIDANIK